ncbi:hypothetical protein CRG98_025759 [Punica granatum]|uniref:Uncharacterized protein n=1 Tax=Punica granatum TaxID=22663 RepID=A0A2I0JCA3_PUNGR|nr:hypothetical protein CRG98_025759 [Punica granatum]
MNQQRRQSKLGSGGGCVEKESTALNRRIRARGSAQWRIAKAAGEVTVGRGSTWQARGKRRGRKQSSCSSVRRRQLGSGLDRNVNFKAKRYK